MINRVILVGRLTKDPILKKVPSGDSVAEFTLAVNRKYGTQQADYIKCIVWRKMAENVYKYCSKGSTVGIEGKLQSRSYDNTQGHKVYVVEVICDSVQFLETRAARERQTQPHQQMQQPYQQPQNNDNFYDMKTVELEKEFDNSINTYDIMEDDIQF